MIDILSSTIEFISALNKSKFDLTPSMFLRGGVHPDYFVKLDFEIAVDQQTRARDRTFEGVPDSG